MIKKDIVRPNEVTQSDVNEIENTENRELTVDEIFALADQELEVLDAQSKAIMEQSLKTKTEKAWWKKEIFSMGVFVVICLISIVVGMIYFGTVIVPDVFNSLSEELMNAQLEMMDIDDDELDIEGLVGKQIILGVSPDDLSNTIENFEEVSFYLGLAKQYYDGEDVDLESLDEEEKKLFDLYYEKYLEQKKLETKDDGETN